MKKYLQYLWYIIRHKWYVCAECFREGLYWRGIVHDNSKLLPDEFIPYARYFYGGKGDIKTRRDETGYYRPTDTGDEAFDFAWLLHQKRNRHHWQWWLLPEDEGGLKILEMEDRYLREMICDWIGAGKAQGHFSPPDDRYLEVRNWWNENRSKMKLHPKTENKVMSILGG